MDLISYMFCLLTDYQDTTDWYLIWIARDINTISIDVSHVRYDSYEFPANEKTAILRDSLSVDSFFLEIEAETILIWWETLLFSLNKIRVNTMEYRPVYKTGRSTCHRLGNPFVGICDLGSNLCTACDGLVNRIIYLLILLWRVFSNSGYTYACAFHVKYLNSGYIRHIFRCSTEYTCNMHIFIYFVAY